MSTQTGRQAEAAAADFLQRKGFSIVQQNWRTRWCEIDIIARHGGAIYFVEVKYRSTGRQGSGLDYITATKLQQMRFAAELWMARDRGAEEYTLAAIEVTGADFTVTNWVDDLW